MPKVVITMPAYRAEQTLPDTVADIPRDVVDLLILVDDASPDNTAQIARELGVDVYVHSENLGYGANQKTCYTEALRSGADVVVLLHPDYQYEPKAVRLLIAPILGGDADMTFGSRFAGLGDPIGGGMPVYRYIGNRVTTVLENLMLGSRFSEMHSGLRAYTRRCLLSLPFLRYSDDFLFDSQLLIDAVTSGQRVVEVPIPTRYTKESSSIAIGRSMWYIGGSLAYCARRAASRGRRGRRSPVAYPDQAVGAPPAAPSQLDRECVVCGGREHALFAYARDESKDANAGAALVRCARCGLVSSSSEGSRDLGERGAQNVLDGVPVRRLAEHIIETIGGYVVRGNRLLVAGRNSQVIVDVAAEHGWRAGEAAAKAPPLPLPGAIARRTAGDTSVGRGGVDAVVLVDALGGAPVEELRGIRSALDREGILAVAAPYVSANDRAPRRPSAGADSIFHFFTPAALHTALARAGFEMVEWAPPMSLAAVSLPARLRSNLVRSLAAPGKGSDRFRSDAVLDSGFSLGVAVGRPADTVSGWRRP